VEFSHVLEAHRFAALLANTIWFYACRYYYEASSSNYSCLPRGNVAMYSWTMHIISNNMNHTIHVITHNMRHTIHTLWNSAMCSRPMVLRRCLLIKSDYIHVITNDMNHTIHVFIDNMNHTTIRTTWNSAMCSRHRFEALRCLLIQFDYIHVVTNNMNHTIHVITNIMNLFMLLLIIWIILFIPRGKQPYARGPSFWNAAR